MKNVNLEIPPIEKLPRQLDFKLENKPQCHSGVRLERCQKTFEKFIKALLKMKISTKVGVLFVIFGCSSGLPQQNGSQLEARTDLIQGCTPQELLDLDNENVACYKRADSDVAIPDYGSQPDICSTIDAKLKCLEKYIGKCLNDRGKENIRLTFLKEQLDLAKKTNRDQQLLSCPSMANFKNRYVEEVFGSLECSFDQVTAIVDKSNECNRIAQEDWTSSVERLANDPLRKESFVLASCNLRREVDKCNIQLYGCMSEQRVAADRANWRHLEAVFTETQGIGEFSFQSSCHL